MNNCWRVFFDVKEMKYYLFLHANGNVIKYEIARATYEELTIMYGKKDGKMTSREKLLFLRHDFYLNEPVDYDSISYFTSIEKDLEILELLKSKHVDIAELKEDDNVNIYNMSMMNQDRLNEDEFKMLKEWLEDDK